VLRRGLLTTTTTPGGSAPRGALSSLLTGLLAAVLAVAACGAVARPEPVSSPPDSGIEGHTLAAPTCPVVVAGNPCPARPISATVVVKEGTGREVARFTSGNDGSYRVPMAPGTYTLSQPAGTQRLPELKPVPVTVVAGRYTALDLTFDTGIR
jgi:hypothetical protein